MRPIDADALLAKMKRTSRYFAVKFDIEEAPTIEAEPVVRCKACEHQQMCKLAQRLGEDGYCSEGVRRSE